MESQVPTTQRGFSVLQTTLIVVLVVILFQFWGPLSSGAKSQDERIVQLLVALKAAEGQHDGGGASLPPVSLSSRPAEVDDRVVQHRETTKVPLPPAVPRIEVPKKPITLATFGEAAKGRRIAVIGAAGYIGSALMGHLAGMGHDYWKVVGFDRNPRAEFFPLVIPTSASSISDTDFAKFDILVFLGGRSIAEFGAWEGHSVGIEGRGTAESRTSDDFVSSLSHVFKRMNSEQLLVVLSSSALLEGSGRQPVDEGHPINENLLDECGIAMLEREVTIQKLVSEAKGKSPTVVILRTGMVVGYSPSQRVDLGHNRLARESLLFGRSLVHYPGSFQAYVWMPDLMETFVQLFYKWQSLGSTTVADNIGGKLHLFHVASFSRRNGQAGSEVAQFTGAPADWEDPHAKKLVQPDRVGHSMNASFVSHVLGVTFQGTPRKVVEDLLSRPYHIVSGRTTLVHTGGLAPCPKCGSPHVQPISELGSHPFVTEDLEEDSTTVSRPRMVPLAVAQCRKCQNRYMSWVGPEMKTPVPVPKQSVAEVIRTPIDKVPSQPLASEGYASSDGARLQVARIWANQMLEDLYAQGNSIIGFGASPAALTVLHFLRSYRPKYEIRSVVDKDSTFHGKRIAGTKLTVRPVGEIFSAGESKFGEDVLLNRPTTSKAASVVVVALNLDDFESLKIAVTTAFSMAPAQQKPACIWLLRIFPQQEIVALTGGNFENHRSVVSNHYRPIPPDQWRYPRKPVVGLVSHYFNEEFLLPYFVQHHAHQFDAATMIDNDSTDKSNEVVRDFAPTNWKIVNLSLGSFDAYQTDVFVSAMEQELPTPWRMSLTTAELFSHNDFRGELATADRTVEAVKYVQQRIVDPDGYPMFHRFESVLKQRFIANILEVDGDPASGRWVHRLRPLAGPVPFSNSQHYGIGRHNVNLHPYPQAEHTAPISRLGFLSKLSFSPWPEIKNRKLQIGGRIPQKHLKEFGWGVQHEVSGQQLEERRRQWIEKFGLHNIAVAFATYANPGKERELRLITECWLHETNGRLFFAIDESHAKQLVAPAKLPYRD